MRANPGRFEFGTVEDPHTRQDFQAMELIAVHLLAVKPVTKKPTECSKREDLPRIRCTMEELLAMSRAECAEVVRSALKIR